MLYCSCMRSFPREFPRTEPVGFRAQPFVRADRKPRLQKGRAQLSGREYIIIYYMYEEAIRSFPVIR